ncbi:uncharacterized protein DS421_16g568630 [Arachis hypogaea]|nr:uncharacterized protein DS421_16g568630 [Arachis hypogaea]
MEQHQRRRTRDGHLWVIACELAQAAGGGHELEDLVPGAHEMEVNVAAAHALVMLGGRRHLGREPTSL